MLRVFSAGFFAPNCQLSYQHNSATCIIYAYHTPRFNLIWNDGSNDQLAWAWVHVTDPTVSLNAHSLRIQCSIAGSGDGQNCDPIENDYEYLIGDPNQNAISGWTLVDNQAIGTVFTMTQINL